MNIPLKHLIFNRWAAFLHDLFWIPLVLFFAYWLRFNLDSIPSIYLASLLKVIVVAMPVQGFLYWNLGLYRGIWRFASIPDLIRIVKAIFLGDLIIILLVVFWFRLTDVPRSVFLLYPILLVAGIVTPRILYRSYKDQRFRLQNDGKRTLIVGAGQAAELLLRDLLHRKEYLPVAMVDDDVAKHGREIHGIRVYGSLKDIADIIKLLEVESVLVAIPTAERELVEQVVEECNRVGVECRTLPSWIEMRGGTVGASQLRPITIEDLLRRKPVKMDIEAIAGYLFGKAILVTGGGGSIGSELCRQVAHHSPSSLLILEHSEYHLYLIEQELRASHPQLNVMPILGDIKNQVRVDWVFKTYKPDVVFHAAAYKHVPMLEGNPAEGVMNNVLGTRTVANAADRYHTDRFVLVSTDKAVNPANIMGATKRISEIYCQNLANRSTTKFITTRFGNVLGSAGSVVPLFEKQIRHGGPLTITHPEIKRYFMTIPEAVSLILQAGSMGRGGEIFVMDMGEPVYIKELARQMVRLSGLTPGKDIEFVYTGLRPGEKLFEEIFYHNEELQNTSHPKLMLAKSREVDWDWLLAEMAGLLESATNRDVALLRGHLQNIVPEYGARKGVEVVQ